MAWNFQNPLSDSPYTGNAAAGTWADFARKMGYTRDPMVTPPADEHYQAPPTLSQDFLDYAKSKGYTFGTNILNRNDSESGLFQNGSLVDSKLHRNTLRDTGLNRTIDTYLPLAIAAAGAYGALGPGGLGSAGNSAIGSSVGAPEALGSFALDAGAFPSLPAAQQAALASSAGASSLASTLAPEALGTFAAGSPGLAPGLLELPAAEQAALAAAAGGAAEASVPAAFNAAKDSAAYSASNGLTGSQLGAMTTAPAVPAQSGLLSSLTSGASAISQFAKDNPLLAKLGMMAAGGLLSVPGGQSGMSGSAGPAKTWSSPLQTGLLNPVEQRMPAPIQSNPNALAVQGNPYAGAWQYLRGG